jgi:DNA-binding Xre family transcriptional regulator
MLLLSLDLIQIAWISGHVLYRKGQNISKSKKITQTKEIAKNKVAAASKGNVKEIKPERLKRLV